MGLLSWFERNGYERVEKTELEKSIAEHKKVSRQSIEIAKRSKEESQSLIQVAEDALSILNKLEKE